MKISELIKQLQQLKKENGDMDVVLTVTDHTDYTYNFEFPGFGADTVYDEDGEFESEDDNGDEIFYCVCGISI
jgi:hypothetical protein